MPNKQANELLLSDDGSHTVRSGQFDTSYHSTHGAIQESRHVFIQSGLEYWLSLNPDKKSIRVFEMGLGTGLNALMTVQAVESTDLNIHYTAVEKYPIHKELFAQLNYSQELGIKTEILQLIHTSEWESDIALSKNVVFQKQQEDLLNIEVSALADIIFYDAFGPRSQPELWDIDAAQKINSLMDENAVFVTYCAQGAFRRNLKSCGLHVTKIPGPPGKREMTRAIKSSKNN